MARPTPFNALPAFLFACVFASSVLARPGRVVAPDGKTLEGDVTENQQDGTVQIVSGGQTYKFNTASLKRPVEYDDSIQVPGKPQPQPPQGQPPAQAGQPQQPAQGGVGMSAEEEFNRRKSALAAGDAAGRVRLARWAFERQEYDLARDAAQEAVTIDPRNREAQDLLRTIDAQRKLNRKTTNTAPPPAGQPPAGRTPATGQPQGGDQGNSPTPPARGQDNGKGNALVPPLSPDEVNRVRLLEWHGEKGVRIRLQNDVKRRYLSHADIPPAQFNKMDAVDQAWEMKKKGSPDLFNNIRLTNDPPSMQEYRTQVQRTVLASCATAACHGGGAGSDRFALHPKAEHDAEAYANFITLSNFRYKPKKGPEASMIDRNRPEDSLLVQFGLPPDMASMPHPDVEGWRPAFRTRNDPKLRTIVRWISDALRPLQDDYGVPFDAQKDKDRGAQPGAADAQQPAADQPRGGDVAPNRPPGGQNPPAAQGQGTGSPRPAPPQRPAPGNR
jgi:hypothetical protein